MAAAAVATTEAWAMAVAVAVSVAIAILFISGIGGGTYVRSGGISLSVILYYILR